MGNNNNIMKNFLAQKPVTQKISNSTIDPQLLENTNPPIVNNITDVEERLNNKQAQYLAAPTDNYFQSDADKA